MVRMKGKACPRADKDHGNGRERWQILSFLLSIEWNRRDQAISLYHQVRQISLVMDSPACSEADAGVRDWIRSRWDQSRCRTTPPPQRPRVASGGASSKRSSSWIHCCALTAGASCALSRSSRGSPSRAPHPRPPVTLEHAPATTAARYADCGATEA